MFKYHSILREKLFYSIQSSNSILREGIKLPKLQSHCNYPLAMQYRKITSHLGSVTQMVLQLSICICSESSETYAKKYWTKFFFWGIFIHFFWMKSEKVNQNQCLTRYTAHVGHSKMPRVLGKRHHLGVEGGKRPPSLPKKKGFRWVDPTLNKNTSYNLHTNFNILRYRENQRRGWRKYCFEYLFSIFPKCMLSVAL